MKSGKKRGMNSERKEGIKGAWRVMKGHTSSVVPLLVMEVWGSEEKRMAMFGRVKFKVLATYSRKDKDGL